MEDNPKKRGLQHLKNKAKYKNSKHVQTKLPPKHKPAKLESNWDRYSEKNDDEILTKESALNQGTDFSVLANAPISKGSHFQFKSDSKEDADIQKIKEPNGLFNLDLNLLALSLATIPFNERCCIPDTYFTEDQFNQMKTTATNNKKKYDDTVTKHKSEYLINIDNSRNDFDTEDVSTHSFKEELDILSKISDDRTTIKKSSNNRKLKIEFENVNKLEELYEKMTLTKQLEKGFVENPPDEQKPISSDSFKTCYNSKVPINSGSSLLETETLQQWLDDVLED